MATLEFDDQHLSSSQYRDLIDASMHQLEEHPQKLMTLRSNAITFDIDRISDTVASSMTSSKEYPFENKDGTSYASVYVATTDEKDAFREKIEQVETLLESYLQKQLEQANLSTHTLDTFLPPLFEPLTSFHTSRQNFQSGKGTGLKYPLQEQYTFEKQRLHVPQQLPATPPWLKTWTLHVTVGDIHTISHQIIDAICTYLGLEQASREEIDEVRDTLTLLAEKPDSHFALLKKIIVQEALARIQRTAKVQYLEYIYAHFRERLAKGKGIQHREGIRLVYTLIQRLRKISDYSSRYGSAHYQVSFAGSRINLLDIFARADAFDPLPIITDIMGYLGESTDYQHGIKIFIHGLKLKLNGSVQNHGGNGLPVFAYNLLFLDADSEEYRKREEQSKSKQYFHEKVLKVAILYYFVFQQFHDPAYDPEADFERDVLQILRTGTDEQKYAALLTLRDQIAITVPPLLEILRTTLVAFLDDETPMRVQPPKKLQLCLKDDVLMKDVDSMITHSIFFQDTVTTNAGKNALRHILIGGATTSQNVICKLPIVLEFEPISFFEQQDSPREEFTMQFDTDNLHVLPVFFAPWESVNRYANVFTSSRIVYCYRHRPHVPPDSERAFVYRFLYQLYAYCFLKMLAKHMSGVPKRHLFFPLACLHADEGTPTATEGETALFSSQGEKYTDETFMHSLAETIAHLLAQDYRSTSQGFHLQTILREGTGGFHKLNSALYSLYSAIPRRFKMPASPSSENTPVAPPQLQKFAVIVVSSRKSDANYKHPDTYWASIYGEVIGMERDGEDICVGTLSTFTMNQSSSVMYEQPAPILAQVKACYEQGYRHILYVARAPYSRTLHISDQLRDDDLYFMRKDVIQAMRQVGPGMKVYPVFCDKYYVVNLRRKKKRSLHVDSLYIDDISDLAHVAMDSNRRALLFLNLFSGAQIDPDRHLYSGVMSYSTLLHIYENDPSYDQYIWSDLLSESVPGSLRREIVDFITLLHFSRYEKPREFGFKLDPYTRIIGDTSVGKSAVFAHMKNKVWFNSLAFLAAVRAVLEREAW